MHQLNDYKDASIEVHKKYTKKSKLIAATSKINDTIRSQ